MPIYEYKCENGHVFDAMQKFSDEPLTKCVECGAAAVRVLTPPAIHFKGSGFHNTDYGKRKTGAAAGNGASSEGGGGSGGGDSGGSGGGGGDTGGGASKASDSSSSGSKSTAKTDS